MLSKGAIIYEITQHINSDARLKDCDIYIDVVNNTKVILTGVVSSLKAKAAAEEHAYMVPQVLFVENYLKVITLLGHQPGADNELKKKVYKALQLTKLLDNPLIEVYALKGKITLQGSVDFYWKKILATKIASSIVNVSEVINNLAITPSKSRKDELVMRRLIVQIARSKLEIENFTLIVQNGFVTINGSISNNKTSEQLKSIILSTIGVRGINDLLKVKI